MPNTLNYTIDLKKLTSITGAAPHCGCKITCTTKKQTCACGLWEFYILDERPCAKIHFTAKKGLDQ
jgi:hypothetical protein